MDAQELRNLQEAYLDVYNELDEAKAEAGASDIVKRDIRSRRFVGAKGEKNYDAMGPTASSWVSAARLRAHKASRGVKKEEYVDEAKVDTGLSDEEKQDVRNDRKFGTAGKGYFNPKGTSELRRGLHKSQRGWKKQDQRRWEGQKESVDLYDIILSHLLDEGYAETPEAAEAIMVNMSEEWRDSIVEETLDEGYVDWQKEKLPSGRSPFHKALDSQFRKYADAQTTRGTQAVRGARGRKAKLAAKQNEVIQKVTQKYHEKGKG